MQAQMAGNDAPEISAAVDHALHAEGTLTQACGDGNSAVRIVEDDTPELMVHEKIKKRVSPPQVARPSEN